MTQTFRNIILLVMLAITSIYSQQHDNVWTFGYTCVPGDSSEFGGTNLYFEDGEIKGEYHCRDIRFAGNLTASISDSDGNLKLMFNGCTLNDGNNDLVEGNELLVRNDTDIEQTWWCDDGFNNPHGAMFLPDPYNEGQYYLFYRDLIAIEDRPYYVSDSFYVAKIEFEAGLPFVSEKKAIVNDTVSIVGISAVKHANGRDWWVIVKNQHNNIYHNVKIDSEGVKLHSSQEVGLFSTIENNGNTTKMSPDGFYFASLDPFYGLEILTFDRADGKFNEYLYVPFWLDPDANLVLDVEFSPSGELLYIAQADTLWQFDMTVNPAEFFSTKEVVGIYDDFTDPFPTNFWLMQKAPDGKIYMSQRNGSQSLHIIHNPDGRGLDCDFRQHDYKLPTVNAFAMPYFPNFRLGPDSTWVATQEFEEIDVVISPNPIRDHFSVRTEVEVEKVELYDVTGNLMLISDDSEVVVGNLPSGVYFCKIYLRKGRLIVTEKIVVY